MYEIEFSKPDKYGEMHSNIEVQNLDVKGALTYLDIKIKNTNETCKYRFDYRDAGTIRRSAAKGEYAVNGRMVNISRNWAQDKLNGFEIIHASGVIDNGKGRLHLWITGLKKALTDLE